MNWQELHNWVAEVEQLTGGHVEIRTHGAMLDISVNWRVGARRYSQREVFTPIEMDDANCGAIIHRLGFVTNQIRRYVEAQK